MTSKELIQYIDHPAQLNADSLNDLHALLERYPYFQAAQLLYLRNLKNLEDLQYHSTLRKASLYASNRARLKTWLETELVLAQTPSSVADSTVHAHPHTVTTPTVSMHGEYTLPMYPTNDVPPLRHQDLIDRFLESNPHIQPVGASTDVDLPSLPDEENPVTDSIFTENLAKIYIRQKHYDKAIRIFEKLNLKYPGKSSYFATQIEFLKKASRLSEPEG